MHFVSFLLITNPVKFFQSKQLKFSYVLGFLFRFVIFDLFLFGTNILTSTVILKCLWWSFKKVKQFWFRDSPYLTALANKRFRSLIVADKHVWLMCMQLCCTGGIAWKSMATLHTKKSNTQLTQESLFSRNLVIKYETKWFIIYPKSGNVRALQLTGPIGQLGSSFSLSE